MAIEAISGIKNNGLTNINFEARKNKKSVPVSNPTATSTVKAIPLAVLLAMSPMTTTNAENIMRGEALQETTEIVQSQNKPVVIFSEKIVTNSRIPFYVNGINSKGNTDSIDKIELSAPKDNKGNWVTYTVNSVVDRELYILSLNGVKEGPLKLTQVTATDNLTNKTYSLLDPTLTGYVKALVEHPYNKSDIKRSSRSDNMILAFDNFYIPKNPEKEISYFPTTQNKGNKNFGKPIPSLTKEIEGSHGIYTIRVYERPNYPDRRNLTIQKNGDDEFRVGSVDKFDVNILGLDSEIDTGVVTGIYLFSGEDLYTSITDDVLGDALLKIREELSSPPFSHDKYNNKFYLEP